MGPKDTSSGDSGPAVAVQRACLCLLQAAHACAEAIGNHAFEIESWALENEDSVESWFDEPEPEEDLAPEVERLQAEVCALKVIVGEWADVVVGRNSEIAMLKAKINSLEMPF